MKSAYPCVIWLRSSVGGWPYGGEETWSGGVSRDVTVTCSCGTAGAGAVRVKPACLRGAGGAVHAR